MKTKEIHDFRKTYQTYNKPCCFDGYKLAVLFDEKDEVKRLGAMWDNDNKTWWMPAQTLSKVVTNPPAQWSGPKDPTVEQYLNYEKMIVGPYGDYRHASTAAASIVFDDEVREEFTLMDKNGDKYTMRIYLSVDAAHVNKKGTGGRYMTIFEGRDIWNELVKEGYNRTINA